jgi:tol-pal system protein YbgF
MKKIKSLGVIAVFLMSCDLAFADKNNQEDLNARIDVLERTVNGIQKSVLNALGSNKNSKDKGVNDSKGIEVLTEEIKLLRGDVEKLEMRVRKNATNFQEFQSTVATRLNEINSKEKNTDSVAAHKDEYIISNISKEIEVDDYQEVNKRKNYQEVAENTTNSDPSQEYQNAYLLLKKKGPDGKVQYDKAKEAFEKFISKYQNNPLTGNAYYWLANIYLQEKNHGKAAIDFLNGYKANPKSGRAIDNLMGLADALLKIGRNKETCSTLNKLYNEFPNITGENKRNADDLYRNAGCINN